MILLMRRLPERQQEGPSVKTMVTAFFSSRWLLPLRVRSLAGSPALNLKLLDKASWVAGGFLLEPTNIGESYSSSEVVIPMILMAYSRQLALFFGVSVAIIEVDYNWQNPSWWPYILVDYFAVSILIYGALKGDRVLTAAWGLTCAMFYLSFFHTIEFG
ncbi:MAG: hypothetical protein P8Q37_09855 [Porticoccaceae bacterium]|nr:hypothetical protein [Porticoccaceae bacterium]